MSDGPRHHVPLHVVLGVLPMPQAMSEDFEVTAKVIHPDYIVEPTPAVIGQYSRDGKIALTLIVHVVPKAFLHEHYKRHAKCLTCKGKGEVEENRDGLKWPVICPSLVSATADKPPEKKTSDEVAQVRRKRKQKYTI